MAVIFFIIGLCIMATAVFFALKSKNSKSKWIAFFTVGVFFATAVMIYPTEWIRDGESVQYPVLYKIASSLFYAFKAIGGGADLDRLETISLDGALKAAYIAVNYILFISAPIFASGLLLSFFGDKGEKIKYFFRFSPECLIFSEVNKNSLALAKSVNADGKKRTTVFCNAKDADAAMLEKAHEMGIISLYKPCFEMKPRRKFKKITYYLISDSESENIKAAHLLASAYINEKKKKSVFVTVNTFVRNTANIDLIESSVPYSEKLQIRFINEVALFCDGFVFEHPLFDLPDGRKDISVMIVGCGDLGMQMLKTVFRNGQIDGYTLKIRVYDRIAQEAEHRFFDKCPELKNLSHDIKFITADTESDVFLEKARESLDATYVCIATGSDNNNLYMANKLFGFFRRENGFSYTPPILIRVRNDDFSENLDSVGSEYLKKRKIYLFGTAASFFSKRTLFNTEIENLAFAVHCCYFGVLGGDKDSPAYKDAVKEYYSHSFNRVSSAAAALHFSSKMLMCRGKVDIGDPFSEDALCEYEAKIQDEKVFESMTENEHLRWNCFMASEGYRSGTMADVKKYHGSTLSHKDEELSKTHPCILPFEELKAFEKEYNEWSGKSKDFIRYDADTVKCLPEIVRFAKKC